MSETDEFQELVDWAKDQQENHGAKRLKLYNDMSTADTVIETDTGEKYPIFIYDKSKGFLKGMNDLCIDFNKKYFKHPERRTKNSFEDLLRDCGGEP